MDYRQRTVGLGADHFALDAHLREVARLLVRALGDRHTLQAHVEAGVVHHGEHQFHAAIGLADEIADGTAAVAVGHDAGRAAVDAELVLEADGAEVVRLAEAAVGVHQPLRHDEEREDRKSTRLNSSHMSISYAVFCLKKKKK